MTVGKESKIVPLNLIQERMSVLKWKLTELESGKFFHASKMHKNDSENIYQNYQNSCEIVQYR